MSQITELVTGLLRQIPEGIGQVWLWGILPVYFVVYLLASMLAMRFAGRAISKDIRSLRRSTPGELLRNVLENFKKAVISVTVYAVLLPVFLALNLRHDTILVTLEENLFNLCSIVIGLTTIVLTVSVVIILFHKNYYLVFTISDVLRSYHFTTCLGILLGSCLGTCACAVLQLYAVGSGIVSKIILLMLEWCMLCCLLASGVSFWIIYRVMFSNDKAELRLLNRLCRIFRGGALPDDAQASPVQSWTLPDVRTNVEYLCAEYVAAARMLPIHRVSSFQYLSGQRREKEKEAVYHRVLRGIIYGALGIWLVSMLAVSLILGREGTGILLMNTIIMAAVTGPLAIALHKSKNRLRILPLFDDTLGYELQMEGAKTVKISRITFKPRNKYDRFVDGMNSLNGFFCVALGRGMRQELTDEAVRFLIDWLSDVKKKHACLYLPVFGAGYFAYCAGQELSCVRECYDMLISHQADPGKEDEVITGTGQEDLDRMLLGHLADLTQGTDAQAQTAAYLDWLHGDV